MHFRKKTLTLLAIIVLTIGLSACATLVGEDTQTLPIVSTPDYALVYIHDETGRQVFKGQTPTAVELPKSTGKYWDGKQYLITVTKPGYAPQVFRVRSAPNAWHLGGNALFGGAIGWFLVDPQSGRMFELSPERIEARLGAHLKPSIAAETQTKADDATESPGVIVPSLKLPLPEVEAAHLIDAPPPVANPTTHVPIDWAALAEAASGLPARSREPGTALVAGHETNTTAALSDAAPTRPESDLSSPDLTATVSLQQPTNTLGTAPTREAHPMGIAPPPPPFNLSR